MEPILIYGVPAGSSMAFIAALEWLGKPYRLTQVDMLSEMLEPSYGRINARHETPAFVTDDGRAVSETMAIAAWLEARDTERRISFDPKSPEADRMHQLMGFINTGYTGAYSPLWSAMEMETANPVMQQSLNEWGRAAVIERHDKLEAWPATVLISSATDRRSPTRSSSASRAGSNITMSRRAAAGQNSMRFASASKPIRP